MSTVDELDRIVCPQSGERLVPEKVWDVKDPKTKQTHRTGVFKKHHHQFRECDYSGMAAPVVREQGPREAPPTLTVALEASSATFCATLAQAEEQLLELTHSFEQIPQEDAYQQSDVLWYLARSWTD